MTLVNWEEHRAQFLALKEEKGITVKEYCEQNGLSFNTARKHLNMKKNEVQSKVKPSKNRARTRQQPRAGGVKIQQQAGRKESEFTKTDNQATTSQFRSMPRKRNADHANKPINNSELVDLPKGSFADTKAKMIPEKDKKPSSCQRSSQMIPGESAQCATLPSKNVAREMMQNGAAEHLRKAILMAQERAIEYQSIVDLEAARLRKEIDVLGDGTPEGIHPAQRLCGLMQDAAYYMNDFISRLAAIYQAEQKLQQGQEKLIQGARQQAFKEAEAREKLDIARLQAEQRSKEIDYRLGADARAARVIATAIRMREREELDDIGVAEYIERQGVSVPAILAARAAKAITLLEPPVADSSDVDDDQIQREAEEYAKQKAELSDWLKQRREDVARVVDQLGLGDYDANGERKAGEFEADDEGLELDPSATADIYDDIAITPPEED
ncbi:DNA pacase A subunit [Escherichia fergusonii]|uniref:DNA pacase A subunit n=1 Tax=Escherichia fergusonii TaxID=564 RepID=UPI00298D4569|nr:DNA pacase A subunit [Escherichia fergusonii]